LNPKHELLKLTKAIPWDQLESEFSVLYSNGPGQSPIPVRLAIGLMILQHMFNVSDERVVEYWIENPYWQAFLRIRLFAMGVSYSSHFADPLEAANRRQWRGKKSPNVCFRCDKNQDCYAARTDQNNR
jgi:hypothetical protein